MSERGDGVGVPEGAFWSDDFDMDLPKVIPSAAEIVGDLAAFPLTTIGKPDPRTGRLNHPACWNGDGGKMLAFFTCGHVAGLNERALPVGYVSPGSGIVECTFWEALRDAWPHQIVLHVDRRPIWDTCLLWPEFQDIMFDLRGWRPQPERAARAKVAVQLSLVKAVASMKDLLGQPEQKRGR